MRRKITIIAAAFALASSGAAAMALTPPPAALPADAEASRDPADAPAGRYSLDPNHASVIWRVRHTGLGLYTARFDSIAGSLAFDPEEPAASTVDVTIDAASVSTGLLNARAERAFDGEIADLLGADDAPQIRFVSRVIERTGAETGLIEGDLTLNGETHPVTLEARFHGGRFVRLRGAYTLAFSGRTIIDRRTWNVGNLIFNQFAGDQVEILIDAEFVKD